MIYFRNFIAAAIVCMPAVAFADDTCMPTGEFRAALKDWYGERIVSVDPQTGHTLWASEQTGTWTLAENRSDGTTCTLDAGEGYAAFEGDDNIFAALAD